MNESPILGERVYRTVKDIETPVDLVNVFRRSEELEEATADLLKSPHGNSPAVWFQLDCVHEGTIASLVAEGRTVVYDRCLMVEHARLIPRG